MPGAPSNPPRLSSPPDEGAAAEWDEASICYNCACSPARPADGSAAGTKKIGGMATMLGSGRHHCRHCGHSFCQSCSTHTAVIPWIGVDREVRVCDTCAADLAAAATGRQSQRRPSVSTQGVQRGWVRAKLGHAGMLDQTRWHPRFFELDHQSLRLFEKRSWAVLEQRAATEEVLLGVQTVIAIENRHAQEMDWVLQIAASEQQLSSDRCLRLKSQSGDEEQSPGGPASWNVIPGLWSGLLRQLASINLQESWSVNQKYGLKPTDEIEELATSSTSVQTASNDSPSRPTGFRVTPTMARRPPIERTLDEIVQSRLVGEVREWGAASSSRARHIGKVQTFDVHLTENHFNIFLVDLRSPNSTLESTHSGPENGRQAEFVLDLVLLNTGCPIVDSANNAFTLETDSFSCVFYCPDEATLLHWADAVSDNLRRLKHVERSRRIAEPTVEHSDSRLRLVMRVLGPGAGCMQDQRQWLNRHTSSNASVPLLSVIQRVFRVTYQTPRSSIPGYLAIGPSRVLFVSNGTGTKLEVSQSQIYNVTLEAGQDSHPLRQVLSFAIQRHITDEWRLTFHCPLEAEQARVLVEKSLHETHGSSNTDIFRSSLGGIEGNNSSFNSGKSPLLWQLQHKFHIPSSDTPRMMVACCILMQQEPGESHHLPMMCPPGAAVAPLGGPGGVELVSGLLAVFDWAVVFVADSGPIPALSALTAKQWHTNGGGHLGEISQTAHRHLRLIVMNSQIERVEWAQEPCRLKLYTLSEASLSIEDQTEPIQFHLVQHGDQLATLLTQITNHHDDFYTPRMPVRNASSAVGSPFSSVGQWQGWTDLRASLHLYKTLHPEMVVLDPSQSDQLPSKIEVYGFDSNGYQLPTPTDWRRALDSCKAGATSREAQLTAIQQYYKASQHDGVLLVTQQLSSLAQGGFPPKVRGDLWMACTFALTKPRQETEGYYVHLLDQVSHIESVYRRKSSGALDETSSVPETLADALDQIHRDIDLDRTDSSHCLMYRRDGLTPAELESGDGLVPEYKELSDAVRRVCCAFVMRNHNRTGFAQGMPSIVLHLLLALPEEHAFWLMCCIFEDMLPDHMGYKGTAMGGVHDVGKEACKTLLENLVDEVYPHFWRYLEEEGPDVRAEVRGNIFEKWMNCLFCGEGCGFPSETVQRILDLVFAQGFHMLFAVAIAVIRLQPLDPLTHHAERFCLLSENQRVIARSLHDADVLIKMACEVALLPQLQPAAIWHAHAALVVKYEQYRLLCAASYEPGVACQFCDKLGSRVTNCCYRGNNNSKQMEEVIPHIVHAVADVNWQGAETNGRTALHYAASAVNVQMVRGLMKHPKIKLNEPDEHGCTPLHLATTKTCLCRSGCSQCTVKQKERVDVVVALLDAKSAMHIQDRAGCTALHNSSTGAGFYPLAQRILQSWWSMEHVEPEQKGFLDLQNKVGYTALHLAAHYGILLTVELLIKYGANVDAKGLLDETPLHTAAQNNQYEVVESLCAHSAAVDSTAGTVGWMPLHVACSEGHHDVAFKLVLHQPIISGNRKLVDVPTLDGYSPLQIAVLGNQGEIVDFLKAMDACFPEHHYDQPNVSMCSSENSIPTQLTPTQSQKLEMSSLRNAFGYDSIEDDNDGSDVTSEISEGPVHL